MFCFWFLSDARRHPVQFPARVCDLTPRLFLLRASHLRHGRRDPPAGAMQDGHRQLQIALESGRRRPGGRWRPLRFQKQFRFGENALAYQARAFAPGGVELPGLPRVATVLDESGGHPPAILHADPRHRHQILHGQVGAQRSFAHLLLDGFW
jgi:hypothetical protein